MRSMKAASSACFNSLLSVTALDPSVGPRNGLGATVVGPSIGSQLGVAKGQNGAGSGKCPCRTRVAHHSVPGGSRWLRPGRVEVVGPVAGGHEVDPSDGPTRPQGSGATEAYGAGERVGAADWLELLGAAVELSVSSATSM